MALKSGLPDLVPWALNALALSSFSARPELPALPSLPGLLPALLQVLSSYPNSLLIYPFQNKHAPSSTSYGANWQSKQPTCCSALSHAQAKTIQGAGALHLITMKTPAACITIHNFLPSGSILRQTEDNRPA
jgi:hypothetical protein